MKKAISIDEPCKFAGEIKRINLKKNPSKRLAKHLETCDKCYKILWERIENHLKPSTLPRKYAKGAKMPRLSGRKEL